MTHREQHEAMNALKQWFISQDINPADAAFMMSKLMAESLVNQSRSIITLQEAINCHAMLLTMDVAAELNR